MAGITQPVSEAEREVLKVLWEQGPVTVREIRDLLVTAGRQWAHTTINTLLGRMEEKGYVTRDTAGFAHVFRASVSRNAFVRGRLSDLANQYCDGDAAPLMLAFARDQKLTEQEIEEFRELLDRLEAKTQKKRERSGKRLKN